MNDCVFCRIISGSIPSYKVYEDDDCVSFLDVNPINKGHLLVVPKVHYESINDLPEVLHSRLYSVARILGLKLINVLGVDGLRVTQNNGGVAGQVVPHFHVHVIPRVSGDSVRYSEVVNPLKISVDEMVLIAETLKKQI